MAPLSLSAKASTSRLTRLSGLSQGTKPSKCSVLQPSKRLLFPAVRVLLGVVVVLKSDFSIALQCGRRICQSDYIYVKNESYRDRMSS